MKGLGHGYLELLVLEQVSNDRVGSPSSVLLDVLQRDACLKTEDLPRLRLWGVYCLVDKPADSAALWNMAWRVEAEMTFPTGGAMVSKSGVKLSGMIQGSMWR